MRSIVFILPYFGKFNNYFQLWLNSCKYNDTIDWLIFTDDKATYQYPPNVKVVFTTFDEVREKIRQQFDFPIVLNNPYLLCEYRVAFGEIFQEDIASYDFWGYCDSDVVWGNLREFLTDDVLNAYNKIGWRGHLTLFRNDKRINSLYRNEINGEKYFKKVFTNESDFPVAFDERAINYIFKKAGEKIYRDLIFADLKIRSFNFLLHHFSDESNYKNQNQVFLWDKGCLLRVYISNNKLYSENFAYIHFLKRDMTITDSVDLLPRFLIVPNKFIEVPPMVSVDLVRKYSTQKIYWRYFFERFTFKYLSQKLRYFKNKARFKKLGWSEIAFYSSATLPEAQNVEFKESVGD